MLCPLQIPRAAIACSRVGPTATNPPYHLNAIIFVRPYLPYYNRLLTLTITSYPPLAMWYASYGYGRSGLEAFLSVHRGPYIAIIAVTVAVVTPSHAAYL